MENRGHIRRQRVMPGIRIVSGSSLQSSIEVRQGKGGQRTRQKVIPGIHIASGSYDSNNNRNERRNWRFSQSPHCARTVSSTWAQMAVAQSCANHVQHIGRSSRTCVPRGTKGQLSYYV